MSGFWTDIQRPRFRREPACEIFFQKPLAILIFAWSFAIVAISGIPAIFDGYLIDTGHIPDTIFLLGAAWRTYQGLVPNVDFPYFYGGMIENVISVMMKAFGHSVFVIEYAWIFLTLILWLLIWAVFSSRISLLNISILVLTVTMLMQTRQALVNRAGFAGGCLV